MPKNPPEVVFKPIFCCENASFFAAFCHYLRLNCLHQFPHAVARGLKVSVACHMYAGVARIGFARATLRGKEKWQKRPLGSENHKTVKNSVTKPPIKILRPLFTLLGQRCRKR